VWNNVFRIARPLCRSTLRSENCHEENISTQQYQTKTSSWLQSSNVDQVGPPCSQKAQGKRTESPLCLALTLMPTGTFSSNFRLTTSADYKAVFDETSIRVSTKSILLLAKRNDLDHPRLGMVVAKKNVRKAVQRNRIKRNIRESYRTNKSQLAGLDLVLLCRNGIDKLDNRFIRTSLADLWTQLTCQTRNSR
jgi:ribonuclease P protein component